MGNILWWRKRPPSEELDELVVQIRELEMQLKHLLADRASILRWLNCFAVLLVAVLSALAWLRHGPLRHRLLSVVAVWLCAVLLLCLIHRLIGSAFGFLIGRKRNRIQLFIERKLAIIESVKENEKYNVAMELIRKYGDEGADNNKKNGTNSSGSSPFLRSKNGTARRKGSKDEDGAADQEQQHNHHQLATTTTAAVNGDSPGARHLQATPGKMPKLYEMRDITAAAGGGTAKRPPMGMGATPWRHPHQRAPIRPFIEQSRTPVDRILDFVMGESINSRYALICSNCHTHNGMAVQEEFDSLSFFCFKCNAFNASKNELRLRSQQPPSSSSPHLSPSSSLLHFESTPSPHQNAEGSAGNENIIASSDEADVVN